jgi:hypothetical protein
MTWFGVLINVMLKYPLLYPGYLIPEEKQTLVTPQFGVSISWILLFMCILVLILVLVLFWTDARFHKGDRIDH